VTAAFEAFPQWLSQVQQRVHGYFQDHFGACWPEPFGDAIRYPLFTGGKRIRPAVCLASYRAIAGDTADLSNAIPVAAAIELIHTYSLVHDDLPCLDNDSVRRGKPTVHVVFGEAPALLVGDSLLTEAFFVLSQLNLAPATTVRLIQTLSQAAGAHGMIGGQAADIGMNGPVTDLDTLTRLHQLKTGKLLSASATMGGLVANATSEQQQALTRYGTSIGLAFQLADDVLDAEEDSAPTGPPSFVKLLGRKETQQRAQALIEAACEAARQLPQPHRLLELAEFVVSRDH